MQPLDEKPEWMKSLKWGESSLGYHLKNNKFESSSSYIWKKDIELGRNALTKKRVYLDMKYWIYMRDVCFGHSKEASHQKLYRLLTEAVKSEKILSPPSHIVLREIFKNKTRSSREKGAIVMDNLSKGVALKPPDELMWFEIRYFLDKYTHNKSPLPPSFFAWTYCANVLGFKMPVSEGFNDQTMNAIQKFWYDLMANRPFSALVDGMDGIQNLDAAFLSQDHVDEQNRMRALHSRDFDTFNDVFLIELFGLLEIEEPIISDIQLQMFRETCGLSAEQPNTAEVD